MDRSVGFIPASGVHAHYIVRQNGEVVQSYEIATLPGTRRRQRGQHRYRALRPCPAGARAKQPRAHAVAPPVRCLRALIRTWICQQYGIPLDRDHVWAAPRRIHENSHRGCPNAVWDWDYYMEMLNHWHELATSGDETFRRRRNGLSLPKANFSPERLQ